jgi:uncharacterized protein YukE
MSFIDMIRDQITQQINVISLQSNMTGQLKTKIQSFVPTVSGAWIGGDADAFAAEVQGRLLPAIDELIAALAGINLNLSHAVGAIDQADQKAKGFADRLGELFDAI